MKRTELDAATRDAAINMIKKGFAPEQVVDFIYQLGYMNGGLDLATLGTARVVEQAGAQKEAA